MDQTIIELRNKFRAALAAADSLDKLEQVQTAFLGRKGALTALLRTVKSLPPDQRPVMGQRANQAKKEFEAELLKARSHVRASAADRQGQEAFDPTAPGTEYDHGHLHPITIIRYQLEDICRQMGFVVLDGPEIESDYFNFTALNIPEDHPARDMQDTFWLKDGNLLRTHTSPVQVRALLRYGVPFRGIVPGRVFRYEATDASHDHTFYQMEGLMVDRGISISNLIATMKALLQSIFLTTVEVRLRPGYFPFVEPGFELDMKCLICTGAGCSVCKHSGWLELMPCGLVHPAVLRAGRVDPQEYSGFAFGMGLTRLAMMKFGIDDIRLFQSGDLRFIRQF